MAHDLRKAVTQDRSAIEAIVAAAYAPYVVRIGRKPGPMLDDYAASIREGRVHVLVDSGEIKGILVLHPEQDAMLIENIAIPPAAQGRGYGRSLLDFAERSAAAAGFRSIRLYTNEAMTENVALYARLGYVETHRGAEKGFRRVYMAKALV